MLFAFNLEHRGKQKVEMFHDFLEFLLKEYSQNRRTVLIVGKAQNMAADTLEELRMLSNVNAETDQGLQIIRVGQAGLRDTFRRANMQQFARRIKGGIFPSHEKKDGDAVIQQRPSGSRRSGQYSSTTRPVSWPMSSIIRCHRLVRPIARTTWTWPIDQRSIPKPRARLRNSVR